MLVKISSLIPSLIGIPWLTAQELAFGKNPISSSLTFFFFLDPLE